MPKFSVIFFCFNCRFSTKFDRIFCSGNRLPNFGKIRSNFMYLKIFCSFRTSDTFWSIFSNFHQILQNTTNLLGHEFSCRTLYHWSAVGWPVRFAGAAAAALLVSVGRPVLCAQQVL
jgi:hypothetical protein